MCYIGSTGRIFSAKLAYVSRVITDCYRYYVKDSNNVKQRGSPSINMQVEAAQTIFSCFCVPDLLLNGVMMYYVGAAADW